MIMYVCIHTYVRTYVHTYIHTCMYTCRHKSLSLSVYIYIYMSVHPYAAYMYIHSRTRFEETMVGYVGSFTHVPFAVIPTIFCSSKSTVSYGFLSFNQSIGVWSIFPRKIREASAFLQKIHDLPYVSHGCSVETLGISQHFQRLPCHGAMARTSISSAKPWSR